jgi:ketosteroid isomerase-like protein
MIGVDTTMTTEQVVRAVLRAVEARDRARLAELYHPDIEFSWPPGLPYSGRHRGAEVVAMGEAFAALWDPLQPTEAERRFDERIVASSGSEVVVQYRWKAVDEQGRRFETDTLARYRVLDGKFAGGRMYHFDHAGLLDFLAARATGPNGRRAGTGQGGRTR